MTIPCRTCYTVRVAVLLALGSALAYGVSDYVGGRASRRRPPVVIALVAELVLLVLTAVVVPLVEADGPTAQATVWGMVGGAAGSMGVLGLYAALARGNMTVVAPITGIVAAILPVAVGVLLGDRPGVVAAIGIVVAIVAVALIGGVVGIGHQPADAGTVLLAIVVGALFGLLFVAYAQTGDDAGLWPLLTSRAASTPLLAVTFVGMERRRPDRHDLGALPPGIAVGALIGIANGLYLLSTREGLLSIVAVLVALYPASTVALASVLDRERPSRWQVTGMAAAAVAVAMITVGA